MWVRGGPSLPVPAQLSRNMIDLIIIMFMESSTSYFCSLQPVTMAVLAVCSGFVMFMWHVFTLMSQKQNRWCQCQRQRGRCDSDLQVQVKMHTTYLCTFLLEEKFCSYIWKSGLPGKKSEDSCDMTLRFQWDKNDDETWVLRIVTKILLLLIPITTSLRT